MTGFTEQEVRDMLTYYSTQFEYNHTIDELTAIMKPWYDNYCFASKKFGKVTMYNSNMVLYFVDNYVNNACEVPDSMIDDNIRTDYSKLRMLIRHDKEFAHDASIIQQNQEKDTRIFTLDGRYLGTDVSQLTKGVYIIGKKKVIIK